MKKFYYLLLTFLMAGVSSCDPSLLDIANENSISTGVFWKTEADAEAAVISIYNMYYRQGTWTRNLYTQLNGMADDGVSYAAWVNLYEFTRFIFTDYNFYESSGKVWTEHYIAIYRTNQVLDKIIDIPFADETHKNDLIGQAKFFRAFYYFYLSAFYDNVPLVLWTSSAGDKPAQNTADEVFTQIEEDLWDAVGKLPPTREPADYGRVTKGAAYAMLAKTYMQHHKYDEAIKCFEWLIDEEGKDYYDLVPNYGDNFSNATENNKEAVLEIQFSLMNYVGFDQTDNFMDANAQLGTQIEMNQTPYNLGWNNIEARRWLVDYFKREKNVEGKNDERLFYTLWYNNAQTDFPDRDATVYGRPWSTWVSTGLNWGDRVFIKKYSTPHAADYWDTHTAPYYWNDNNYRLIRYADLLLLYAEALNETSGTPPPKAVECVNRVRNRAKLPNLQNSTYYNGAQIVGSKDLFREHLKIERGLELAFECVRWIDLKRWGLNDQATINELRSRDEDFNNFVIGKNHCMPIPQNEVDNNPNLYQNAGY
jgi:hypothetical protein